MVIHAPTRDSQWELTQSGCSHATSLAWTDIMAITDPAFACSLGALNTCLLSEYRASPKERISLTWAQTP